MPDSDLDKCLDSCRVSELTEARNKTIESSELEHGVNAAEGSGVKPPANITMSRVKEI